jgi:methyl-accepting chemotaxis protein
MGAKKVGEIIGEIKAVSYEQDQGIEQIDKAITSMEKVIQRNTADTEETDSSSEEMSAQEETLKAFVGQLLSLVGNRKNNKGLEIARPLEEMICHSMK